MSDRQRRGARRRFTAGMVNLSFLLSAAASAGLAVVYVRGGQPQLEGALLFVALGGIAVGLIAWAHRFLPQGPYVQARHALPSSERQRAAFAESFERGPAAIERRSLLAKMLALAAGALGVAALLPIRSLGSAPGRALFRTSWRRGLRVVTADGTPVNVADLELGSVLTVFPEGHTAAADSQTLLIRMDPSALRPRPGRESWTPDGYVAYSKLCTHAGCPVGLYEQHSRRLFCPCHQSIFDAADGAEPMGGPATRPLPQLPLEVDEAGYLRARDDYDEPVGPWFWNAGD